MQHLPLLNAILNSLATLLLIVGRVLIAQKKTKAHENTMLAAFAVSCVFLISYVTHKIWKGGVNTHFNATGPLQYLYLTILFTHLVLAMTVPVLAILLIRWGWRNEIAKHKNLANIAWPIWLYVSITGVIIYLMLYPLNPH